MSSTFSLPRSSHTRNQTRLLSSAFSTTSRSPLFFFNDTATTEIYTLSLHDALPISQEWFASAPPPEGDGEVLVIQFDSKRSEEHTSELQSRLHLVCRLLLEKKKRRACRRRRRSA